MMKQFFKDLEKIIKTMDRKPIGMLLNALESLQRAKMFYRDAQEAGYIL